MLQIAWTSKKNEAKNKLVVGSPSKENYTIFQPTLSCLQKNLLCSNISKKLKSQLYRKLLLPGLTYGSETWIITFKQRTILEQSQQPGEEGAIMNFIKPSRLSVAWIFSVTSDQGVLDTKY